MPEHLIEGLRRFRREVFPRYREHYEELVRKGQSPSTLFIGCADSRVVPELFTGVDPGELFHVRNVGAFVPPFESDYGYHGTSAAIEFASLVLRVDNVVVCGHTHCGAIRALYDAPTAQTPHIERWLELAHEARVEGPVDEALLRRTEQRSIALQLQRLLTYPDLRSRVEDGTISLHGWHYIIEEGTIDILDVERGEFVRMTA
ncbi:MAG TPA: carbonic anhydrase [Longimicrobiales bacterium]|jgi:carbonic anhydrase|nr:carbonic anhydrase [Longimicrobiales bacterium]